MCFIELTNYRDGHPVLICIDKICSIEGLIDYTEINLPDCRHYVKEDYSEIVACLRDRLGEVV